MPRFSRGSMQRLKTCHEDLQLLFLTVVRNYDCTITDGHRDKATQDKYFKQGLSKLKYPESKHNKKPSMAVDVAPFVSGKLSFDHKQCYNFAGFVMATALTLGIKVRWGGDWDQDRDVKDQTFNDLVHFELV